MATLNTIQLFEEKLKALKSESLEIDQKFNEREKEISRHGQFIKDKGNEEAFRAYYYPVRDDAVMTYKCKLQKLQDKIINLVNETLNAI